MNKFWVAVLLMFVVASLLIDDRYCITCVRKNLKTVIKWLLYDLH